MLELVDSPHANSVKTMFTRISPYYDLMNRLMSAGQDLRWRNIAVQSAELEPGDVLLDVATGTGDMVYLVQSLIPKVRIVAVDFAIGMMREGKKRTDSLVRRASAIPSEECASEKTLPGWTAADTYALPFPSHSFNAVTSSFLLRNLNDPLAGLLEQARVLKPGGRLVMLDATPPPHHWARPFINFHLYKIIPFLGSLISKQPDAYRYFPESIAHFLRPEAIEDLFRQAGLVKVTHKSFMFGTAALVTGTKPAR